VADGESALVCIDDNHYTDSCPQNVGPSQTAPPFDIPDSRRRSGNDSEAPKSPWTGAWEPHSLAEFMPERWLRKGEDGIDVFDPQAGPNFSFGVGPRGCFGEYTTLEDVAVDFVDISQVHSLMIPKGRRLAMHTMKTLFTLVLWEFELLLLPKELDDMAPIDLLTHHPMFNYVRLRAHSLG
jgi:hypothetical protein